MASHQSQLEIIENLKSLTQEIIVPEPECRTFMKYLAKYFDGKCNQKEAIVHLINSHGLQLRNDLKYQLNKREESMSDGSKMMGPVLEVSDFRLFNNFDDILEKIKELPEEWTVIQITKRFIPLDMLKDLKDHCDPGIFIIRFSCGKLAERLYPYYVATESRSQIEEDFMQLLKDLFKIRREYFTSGGTSRKMKEEYSNTDSGLMKFIFEMENHWLKEWRCLLGGRMEDKKLETETIQQVKMAVDNFLQKSKSKTRCVTAESLDMIYQATLSAHLLKNKEILTVLNYALNKKKGESLNDLAPLMEDLKRINLGNSCAVKRATKNPVILVIDNAFELIPWEMVSTLLGQPVCRISSLHLLYSLFRFHKDSIVDGYRRVTIDCGYCLINPDKDLNECEKEITAFLSAKMPWIETEVGKVPDPKSLVARFENFNVFFICSNLRHRVQVENEKNYTGQTSLTDARQIRSGIKFSVYYAYFPARNDKCDKFMTDCYCGHGSGTQYVKCCDLKKALVKGLVLLFGCSSNLPKSAGGRTPYNNETYTYIINGCPCLIGCIYDIASTDADIACKEILSSFLPSLRQKGSETIFEMPLETDVLKGLVAGKKACKKFWSQCAFVARGIPCKTVEGNVQYRTKHKR